MSKTPSKQFYEFDTFSMISCKLHIYSWYFFLDFWPLWFPKKSMNFSHRIFPRCCVAKLQMQTLVAQPYSPPKNTSSCLEKGNLTWLLVFRKVKLKFVFRGVEILTLALALKWGNESFFSRFVFIFSFNLFMSVWKEEDGHGDCGFLAARRSPLELWKLGLFKPF